MVTPAEAPVENVKVDEVDVPPALVEDTVKVYAVLALSPVSVTLCDVVGVDPEPSFGTASPGHPLVWPYDTKSRLGTVAIDVVQVIVAVDDPGEPEDTFVMRVSGYWMKIPPPVLKADPLPLP